MCYFLRPVVKSILYTLNEVGFHISRSCFIIQSCFLILIQVICMLSTLASNLDHDLEDLNDKSDLLDPGELRAKLLRLANEGRGCSCASQGNCFMFAKNPPAIKHGLSHPSAQFCGLVSSSSSVDRCVLLSFNF
jgi:hypothetical protein